MPSWSEVQQEIFSLATAGDTNPIQTVRRKYIDALSKKTGRATIVYYSGWLSAPAFLPSHVINDDDKSGFMQAAHKVAHQSGLDLVLHTPGGVCDCGRVHRGLFAEVVQRRYQGDCSSDRNVCWNNDCLRVEGNSYGAAVQFGSNRPPS